MKNRHRVSQVVSKLICSTGGQRKLLKQGTPQWSARPKRIGVAENWPLAAFRRTSLSKN
jgi:hypothetical protein